jgi:hypothetical protein
MTNETVRFNDGSESVEAIA